MKKILSIVLCLVLLLGVVPFPKKVLASSTEADGVYYVSPGGSGDGKTADAPLGTISAVIQKIKDDGLDDSDKEITVYIDGTSSYNLTSYTSDDGSILSYNNSLSHECTITYKSLDSTKRAKLSVDILANKSNHMEIVGPSIFENIDLVTLNNSERKLFTNGYFVELRNIQKYKNSSTGFSKDTRTASNGLCIVAGSPNLTEDAEVSGTTLSINNSGEDSTYGINTVHLGTYIKNGKTTRTTVYTGNVNLYMNSANTANGTRTKIYYAVPSNGYNKFTNVNVILNNGTKANGIHNETITSGTNNYPVADAVQYILNQGSTFDYNGSITVPDSYDVKVYKDNTFTELAPVYCLYSDAGSKGNLDVTETAGVYTVTEGYDATATLVSDSSVTYTSSKGTLTVEQPGNYIVTYEEAVVEEEDTDPTIYYLAAGGIGSGKTANSPAGSIQDVIATIKEDGYGEGDDVTVKIDGASQPTTYSEENVADFMGYRGATLSDTPTYACTITFTSLDTDAPAMIAYSNDTKGFSLSIQGPTIFKDIVLLDNSLEGTQSIFCQGNDVRFDNVTHKYNKDGAFAVKSRSASSGAILKVYSGKYGTANIAGTTLTFDSSSTNANNGGFIYLGTSSGVNTYTDDANVIINGGDTRFRVKVQSSTNAVFEKNVNIVLNDVSTINPIGIATNGTATVEGAIQVILNYGSYVDTSVGNTLDDIDITAYKSDGTTETPIYLLWSDDDTCSLNYTKDAGVYTVEGEKMAVAICREDNSKYAYSVDGTLKVPQAGSYDVTFVDEANYVNVGHTIEIIEECTLTFADLAHGEKEGYLFIGWKNGGEYAQDGKFSKGTKLTAEYIAFDKDSDLVVTGTELRGDSPKGLRYIVKNTNVLSNVVTVNEVGTVVIPSDALKDKVDVECDQTYNGYAAISVPAERICTHARTYKEYTVCITEISNYERFYTARGYVKYTDLNGVERIAYSDYEVSSAYNTANALSEEQVAGLDELTKAFYDEIMNAFSLAKAAYKAQATTKVMNIADDENSLIYKLENGVYVREANINSVSTGKNPTTIVQISDMHFNYFNERDIAENNPTVMATMAKRTWGSKDTVRTSSAMEYAKYYGDATVLTGDVIDSLSWGALEMFQKSVWDRYPNALVTPGNHEKHMQVEQTTVPETLSYEEREARLNAIWNSYGHNLRYESKLVNDNVLVISIDNGDGHYFDEQIPLLTEDIQMARENGYTVLLFQHVPVSTGDENDAAIKPYSSEGAYGDNVEGTVDMYNRIGASDRTSDTDTDKAIYELITSNADVIKGIFCGHLHADVFSEVNAKTSNDEDAIIPQYVLTSSVYSATKGAVLKITVK